MVLEQIQRTKRGMSTRIPIPKQEQGELFKIIAPDDDYTVQGKKSPSTPPTKVAIFGSRSIMDVRAKVVINEILSEYPTITAIVTTQEPRGVCEIAQAVAKEKSLILELHFLDFKYVKGAFEHRSYDVIKSADFVLLIHDGVSKGTKNELGYTLKSKKPYRYIVMQPSNVYTDRNVGENMIA